MACSQRLADVVQRTLPCTSPKFAYACEYGPTAVFDLRCGRFLPALILGLDRPLDDLIIACEARPKKGPVSLLTPHVQRQAFCEPVKVVPSSRLVPSADQAEATVYCTC